MTTKGDVMKAEQMVTLELITQARAEPGPLADCILGTFQKATAEFIAEIRAGHPGRELRMRILVVDGLESGKNPA
jgi:hypothetical protein